jgi:hypothetical protein
MLDGKAFKALLSGETDSDLVPRLGDPALLQAFAALADDLRTVIGHQPRELPIVSLPAEAGIVPIAPIECRTRRS